MKTELWKITNDHPRHKTLIVQVFVPTNEDPLCYAMRNNHKLRSIPMTTGEVNEAGEPTGGRTKFKIVRVG